LLNLLKHKEEKMNITSTAFNEGETIPRKYTCDGQDISPPLSWSGAPSGTKTFALIADDPDAPGGTWVHWVMYNIPAGTTALQEGVPASKTLSDGSVQGINDFKKIGYGGPCPPGGTHRYFFKLYALSGSVDIGGGATKDQLLPAMEGKILGETRLMGTYSR
jgi:Raf kinase inhibitor-like YbhB/YbcL family protein